MLESQGEKSCRLRQQPQPHAAGASRECADVRWCCAWCTGVLGGGCCEGEQRGAFLLDGQQLGAAPPPDPQAIIAPGARLAAHLPAMYKAGMLCRDLLSWW